MWKNKKYKSNFKGSYEFMQLKNPAMYAKERVFVLTNGKKIISFESWQAAKKLGWVRV